MSNTRERAQLIEKVKQTVQPKAQRIRRYEKRKNLYIQNKLFKDTKNFYRYWEAETVEMKDHPRMEEVELYWKSLWEKKVQHNEKTEWITRKDEKKIKNMNWMPTRIMETT
jgi:hypothetical protein